jgi:hypothetical protein
MDIRIDYQLLIDDLREMIRDDANYQRLICILSIFVKFESKLMLTDEIRQCLMRLLLQSSDDISGFALNLITNQNGIDLLMANRLFDEWCASKEKNNTSAVMKAIIARYALII